MTLVVFSDKTPVEAFEDVCAQESQHSSKHDRVAQWPQGKDIRLVRNGDAQLVVAGNHHHKMKICEYAVQPTEPKHETFPFSEPQCKADGPQ